MKSIPCRSTSFMLSQSFWDGLKSVYRSESGRWTIWGIGKSSRKNIYCTHLVPICSSHKGVVEFWGLPPLILFFNMSTGWFGRFVLSTIVNQNKEAWLQESKLAKMLCTSHREFGTNRCKFLPKVKHFIF